MGNEHDGSGESEYIPLPNRSGLFAPIFVTINPAYPRW
jgi:hypothetical protein